MKYIQTLLICSMFFTGFTLCELPANMLTSVVNIYTNVNNIMAENIGAYTKIDLPTIIEEAQKYIEKVDLNSTVTEVIFSAQVEAVKFCNEHLLNRITALQEKAQNMV